MGLMHLNTPAPTPTTTPRPPGVTCEKYARGEGNRCAHYVKGGACTLPGESACLEWLKVNSSRAPAINDVKGKAPPVARDLFGHPVTGPKPAPKTKAAGPVLPPKPAARPPQAATPPAKAEPPATDGLSGLTTDDITSFKALGAEVHFKSDTYGDVWLVPAYTGHPRKELTVEHAATIVRVLAAFPGSRVLAFNKPTTNQERQERQHQEKRS